MTKATCYHNNDELDAILKHHVTVIMMNYATKASCYHKIIDAILKHHVMMQLKHHVDD